MIERRPHWDDDLIRSVHRVSPVSMLMPPNDVYAIIAAVEDWMDANDNPLPHVLNECLQWLDAERAAIQRVRELHGRHDPNCPYGQDCAGAGLCLACREEYPCATIRAVDGEQ